MKDWHLNEMNLEVSLFFCCYDIVSRQPKGIFGDKITDSPLGTLVWESTAAIGVAFVWPSVLVAGISVLVDFWTSDDVCRSSERAEDDWYSGTVEEVAEEGDFWTSVDVFELVEEVHDEGWCSWGGAEGDWWTSEVCGWYSGTFEVIGEPGDFGMLNDVFELIEEVRDDGCCSWGGAEGNIWSSELWDW